LIASILNRFSTARDIVRFAFRFFGGRVALIDRRGSLTYRQVAERALRLSAAMEAQGICKGDIVFTWLPETGEQYELRLATFENGAVAAMFHQALPAQAALQSIRTLKPRLFVYDAGMAREPHRPGQGRVSAVADHCPGCGVRKAARSPCAPAKPRRAGAG
jgi:acyl-coenzyme A synthetase/AMP-(fatty) acid ligase